MAKRRIIFMVTFLLISYGYLIAQTMTNNVREQKEDDFYTIYTVPVPEHIALEVGGMCFTPNNVLAVATRHGEVWMIDNPYSRNGKLPSYRLFAQGLHEPLGLSYINHSFFLAQRSELTKLLDTNGDGKADNYQTVYSWPLSGNYHEYAYGPKLDRDSNMIVTLNLAWVEDHTESLSRWHGWMLKFNANGQMIPYATGMRSPAGFGLNSEKDIFYSENQGDWVGSGGITEVEKGDFVGNPAGLVWSTLPGSTVKLKKEDIPDSNEPKYEVAKRIPGLKPPSVWFPHTILGISTSDILCSSRDSKIGPFDGQLFVGDQGQSKIMRVYTEKVKGDYQGIVFPFKEGFSSGILRMCWGSDGSIFVGMTSRGWAATGQDPYGLQILEWNGKIPFEMRSVSAKPDGFEVAFTQPVDTISAKDPQSWNFKTFTYQYHHNYGSPVINEGRCNIKAIAVSEDKLRVRLVLDSMKEGYIHEIKAEGVLSDERYRLLHNFGYYTLNHIPEGDTLGIDQTNRILSLHHHVVPMASVAAGSIKKTFSKRLIRQPLEWKGVVDRTFEIGTRPGLKFDIQNLLVKAGSKVKITFRNNDDMLHNLVITKPGMADRVGEAATKMGLTGEKFNYVPAMTDVLFHTKLLHPRETESLYFIAPSKPGDYPYICTYPGHYIVMRGVLKVTSQ